MTIEKQKSSPDEMHQALHVMQERILHSALYYTKEINTRTLRALQDLDLFHEETETLGGDVDVEVLRDPRHPRLVSLSPGPLRLYTAEDDPKRRFLVELPGLVLWERQAVRETALRCLQNEVPITPRTAKILSDTRDALLSSEPERWRPAAITVTDALRDDLLLALHGTRQCLECAHPPQESLNEYTRKVLYPSVSSFDSIRLTSGNPAEDHKAVSALITEIVSDADSLTEVCDGYQEKLGFFPLAPKFSLAQAVEEWCGIHPETDVWEEIRDWATGPTCSLRRYHACTVFILKPDLVPEDQRPALWEFVISILREMTREEKDNPEYEYWCLRRDLVRHYAYHLEARLSQADSTRIAVFAWWLAEQTASIIPDNPKSAEFYREHWITSSLSISTQTWLYASPPTGTSFWRYVSLTIPSPWAASLLALLGTTLDRLEPAKQRNDIREILSAVLMGSDVLACIPFAIEMPQDPTFAFECPLATTMRKWADLQPPEEQRVFDEILESNRKLQSAADLCRALRGLDQCISIEQFIIALTLKAKAFSDPDVGEKVWEIISDAEWRRDVLANLEEKVQAMVIEALNPIAVQQQGKWFSELPHFLAELCEESQDPARRRILFMYVLYMSLAADSVSAVHRLLRGRHRAELAQYAQEYREQAEAMRPHLPQWVAGKLRGLIASLPPLDPATREEGQEMPECD